MAEQVQNPFSPVFEEFRRIVREEIAAASNGSGQFPALLTPEELAIKMNIPVSWVYEQSRQGNIPTHRIGRYIRFDLTEVLESQKKKENVFPLTRIK